MSNDKKDNDTNPPKETGKPVRLSGGVEIFPEMRLPDLDNGVAKAYHATLGKRSKTELFALVCDPLILPRLNAIDAYTRATGDHTLLLSRYNKVYWPPLKQEVFVLIYKKTISTKVTTEQNAPKLDWSYDQIMNIAVPGLVSNLSDLHQREFYHGQICANNLYFDAERKNVLLGDCLSVPASYQLPTIYNTVRRAMSDPIARNKGSLSDDVYAFGVTLAVLYRATDPMAGLDEDQIIAHKVEHSSYTSLLGTTRVKNDFLELLRGTLVDDPSERWTIHDIIQWYDGQRLSPKQSKRAKKAQRAISFEGKKYLYKTLLAAQMGKSPLEGMKLIENDTLQQWLKRAANDETSMLRIEKSIVKANPDRKKDYEHRLTAYASIVLDGDAPIRYKQYRLMADGIGMSMVYNHMCGKSTAPHVELIQTTIISEWITAQDSATIDQTEVRLRFDKCKKHLAEPKIGQGLERCMYVLSPEAPCLSPIFTNYFIRSAEDLLHAFEKIIENEECPKSFLDRHVAAFLLARDRKSIDPFIYDINSPHEYKNIVGELGVMARIQKLYNIKNLNHTAEYISKKLDPVYKRFHDKELQEKLKSNIEKHAKSGNLIQMVSVLDSIDLKKRDLGKFYRAIKDYKTLNAELNFLTKSLENKARYKKSLSHTIAAGCAVAVAVFIIFIFISSGGSNDFAF